MTGCSMTQPEAPLGFAQRLQRDHAVTLAVLGVDAAAQQPRRDALSQLTALGLPGLRDDDFRYANLRPLARAGFAPAAVPGDLATALTPLLPPRLEGFTRCVLVNGQLATAYSDPMAALAAAGLGLAVNSGGVAQLPPVGPAERFQWLGQAFAPAPLDLCLGDGVRLELLCVTLPDAQGHAAYPQLRVQVQPGADVTLVERHLGGAAGALTNAGVELVVSRDAQLRHCRLQEQSFEATWIDTLRASVAANAHYQLSLLSLGAATARSSLRLRLSGQGARLVLDGASLADGTRVLDTAIRVEHEARDTRSEQLLRAVANDQSGIGIASRVEVAAHAGGADSRQSLKGLITARGAEVNLRPQLEILTDEVSASHGATTGALDDAMLFYLLSRGLDADTARKLLEWAFIADVMARIPLPALRRQVELATVTRMGNAAALESLL